MSKHKCTVCGEHFDSNVITTIFNNRYCTDACKEKGEGRFNPAKEAAKQVGGSHYQLAIQPIEYILENKLGYCEGNVIKYVTRHDKKNGAEDIKKAIHYLEFILKDKYYEHNSMDD